MIKELWSDGKVGISVNADEFITYDKDVIGAFNPLTGKATVNEGAEKQLNKRYHSTMAGAIKNIATRVSRHDADTLHQYVKMFQAKVDELIAELGGVV